MPDNRSVTIQPSLNAENLKTAFRDWYGLAGCCFAGRSSALFSN
ncbi:hypothetical protein [Rhizobium sp. CF142]|nr:hypothetical protein [Rhizobium sp. CF142]